MKSTDSAGESDPAVAAAVRLLHRRRGWIWATAISVVAFLVACGLLGARAPDASGAGVGVASVFILLLAATAVVGLVAAIVDTVRVHRLEPGVRAQAAPRTVHYPVRAHAYRYPPRHRWTWVFSWLVMAILLGLGVAALPALVNGVAYLAGAENTATFIPTSFGQMCGRGGCSTITNGYLGTGSNRRPRDLAGPGTDRRAVHRAGARLELGFRRSADQRRRERDRLHCPRRPARRVRCAHPVRHL